MYKIMRYLFKSIQIYKPTQDVNTLNLLTSYMILGLGLYYI